MGNPTLPDGYISKRSILIKYGFNARTIENLVTAGVLESSSDGGILLSSLANLQEGSHYVVCAECGSMAGQITTKHLRFCSGMDLQSYIRKHPSARILSGLVHRHRAKTFQQKCQQSIVLKKRFKSPEGELTRQQISEAARRNMQSGYKEKAVAHLREINQDPVQKILRSIESKERWTSGKMREIVQAWHKDNNILSQQLAANARSYIKKTFTKPHKMLEEALLEAGVAGMIREQLVGYYHIDEALSDIKVAIEIDGCYWHGCSKCGFKGIKGTHALDKRKTSYLKSRGWAMIRVRECDLNSDLEVCVHRVLQFISLRRNILNAA